MSGFLTIPTILQIAQVSEYLAVVDIAKNNIFSGGDISENQARLIYMERMAVLNRYNLNPSDTTLQGAANYLLSICRQWIPQAKTILNNLIGALPIITGPANQSVNVGQTATFSVSVVSSTNITYQWFLNNVLIPGANSSSYSVTNAQLAQSGGLYSVQATNSTGTVTSNQATLTVTAALVASYYYGNTDYSNDINAGNDDVPYVGTFPITAGQPLSFTWPSGAANNVFIVVRYPVAESTKTAYANAPLNNGVIPSIAFDNVKTIGQFKYIFSRNGNPFSQNTAAPLIFS